MRKFADIALIQLDGRRAVIECTSLPPVEFELADDFVVDDARFYELACSEVEQSIQHGKEALGIDR